MYQNKRQIVLDKDTEYQNKLLAGEDHSEGT